MNDSIATRNVPTEYIIAIDTDNQLRPYTVHKTHSVPFMRT